VIFSFYAHNISAYNNPYLNSTSRDCASHIEQSNQQILCESGQAGQLSLLQHLHVVLWLLRSHLLRYQSSYTNQNGLPDQCGFSTFTKPKTTPIVNLMVSEVLNVKLETYKKYITINFLFIIIGRFRQLYWINVNKRKRI
jgi:hypothetical protein